MALSAQLNQNTTSAHHLQSSYARMYSTFSRCSLFVEENALCTREINAVGCATQGSAATLSMVQLLLRMLVEERTPSEKRTSLSAKSHRDDEAEVGLSSVKSLVRRTTVDASVLRRAIVLVRATCVSWHCAAFILADSSESHADGSITSVVTSLRGLFQSMWTSLDRRERCNSSSSDSGGDSPESLSGFEDNLFNQIESVTLEAEQFLRPYMAVIGISMLPALPSFQTGRKGLAASGYGELEESGKSLSALSDGDRALRHFHLSCQSSFLMLASDILVAYVETRMSQAMTTTPILSPLTFEEDGEDSSKNTQILPLNSGVIGDLCRTVRSELDSLGFLTPGHTVNVSTTRQKESGEEGSATGSGSGSGSGSDVIRSCALGCYDSLLDLVLNSHGPGSDEVNASPAQLRDCLSKISYMKNVTSAPKGSVRAGDSSTEQVNILNITCSVDAERLWQTLNATDLQVSDDSQGSDVLGGEWSRLSVWRGRSKIQRDVLAAWEMSQAELVTLRAGIKDAQKELQARAEELKAAKSANNDMGNVLALQEQEQQQFSSDTSGSGALAILGVVPSPRARFTDAVPSPPKGDVAKLKAEIEVQQLRLM